MFLYLYILAGIIILGTAIETIRSMCGSKKIKLYALEAIIIVLWPIVLLGCVCMGDGDDD